LLISGCSGVDHLFDHAHQTFRINPTDRKQHMLVSQRRPMAASFPTHLFGVREGDFGGISVPSVRLPVQDLVRGRLKARLLAAPLFSAVHSHRVLSPSFGNHFDSFAPRFPDQ